MQDSGRREQKVELSFQDNVDSPENHGPLLIPTPIVEDLKKKTNETIYILEVFSASSSQV